MWLRLRTGKHAFGQVDPKGYEKIGASMRANLSFPAEGVLGLLSSTAPGSRKLSLKIGGAWTQAAYDGQDSDSGLERAL